MKAILPVSVFLAVAGLILSCAGSVSGADVKIATVNLRKVFEKYYKTVQSTAIIKQDAGDMEKERKQNAELQRQIGAKEPNSDQNTAPIPRPSGTAGTDFSIQEAMGLAGSVKKYETYKAIQVRNNLVHV